MPGEGQNIIELGFNLEELTAEKKQVLDLFVDLFGKLQAYDGTKFNPLGNGGLADLKKSLTDGASAMGAFQKTAEKFNETVTTQFERQRNSRKATDDLTQSEKIHQKTLQDTITLKARISEADTNAANDKAIEQQRLKAITAEVNANAKAYLTQIGSIDEAKATIKQLTIERDKENTTTTEGKARIVELNAEIDRNNEIIRANSSALEQQKINIGNYTGAVTILQSSLEHVSQQIESMAAAGNIANEAYQKLVLEQKLLQQQLEKQQGGFGTVTAELRSMKTALDGLALAGLENTEAFHQLNEVYTTAKQKVNELHEEQKILTSEEPAFTALAAAARGLGGAYAVGAGASALFAEGNEKVEKELNKLVAIMTLLQGLEEAVKAIKDRGAIATALQASASKLLVAAREIEVKIFGTSATVTEADTAAKALNSEATVINAEAAEANAASVVINTEAMEGTVIATEAGTAATIGFRTALISTGIGAIIIGLIYGITKLVGAISDWSQQDEKAAEKQKALAESSKELINVYNELNEALTEGDRKRLDLAEKQDAKTKAAGQNQFIQLDNERRIQLQRLALSKEQIAFQEVEGEKLDVLNEKRIEAITKVQAAQVTVNAAKAADAKESDIKELEGKQALAKAELDLITSQYTAGFQATKDYQDSKAKLEENAIAQAKAAFDQMQKLASDAADRRYAVEKEANDKVLNDDNSSFAGRLTAVSNNYGAEALLEKAHEIAVKQQLARGIITEAEAGNQLANLRNELNIKYKKALEDQRKIRIEANDRELEARNSISKSGNESDASIQEAITKDVQRELDARLNALKQNIADKTQIIADDYTLQVKLSREHGKTETEIAAITAEKDKALVELTAATQKEIYDIVVSWGDKKLKALQEQDKAENSGNTVLANYNKETSALDAALIARTISYDKYVSDKRKLDNKYAIEKDAADIKDDEAALKRIRDFEENQLKIKLEFATKALDVAKAGGNEDEIAAAQSKVNALLDVQKKAAASENEITDKKNKDEAKSNADKVALIEAAEKTLQGKTNQLKEQAYTFAVSLVDDYYEKRINKIQEEIDANDKQSADQIAAIQRSTLSQQDQAAETIIIQGQQRARDAQLKNEQKQEKIKEAKFDRDMAVAKVVWDTERAIVKDIADNPFPLNLGIAAADAALGAVSIATILAKPIPTYAEGIGIPGKGTHPGGPALTGEAGPELVTIPGQKPFIVDKPTLLDLPVNVSVMPLDPRNIVFDMAGTMMMRGAAMINNQPERNDGVVNAIDRQTATLRKSFKQSQRKIINVIKMPPEMRGLDADYLNTKILGKR